VAWLNRPTLLFARRDCYRLSAVYSCSSPGAGDVREDNRNNYFLLLRPYIFHTTAKWSSAASPGTLPGLNNLYEAPSSLPGRWCRLPGLRRVVAGCVFSEPSPAHSVFMGDVCPDARLDPPHGPKPEFGNAWASLHAALIFCHSALSASGSVAALMYLTQEHD